MKNICISCVGENNLKRQWTEWRPLIKFLTRNNKVYLLGTATERDYYVKTIDVYNDNIIDLFGQTDIVQAIELIKGCDLFIGGDTGLSHIAYYYVNPTFIIHQLPDYVLRCGHINAANVTLFYRPSWEDVADKIITTTDFF